VDYEVVCPRLTEEEREERKPRTGMKMQVFRVSKLQRKEKEDKVIDRRTPIKNRVIWPLGFWRQSMKAKVAAKSIEVKGVRDKSHSITIGTHLQSMPKR